MQVNVDLPAKHKRRPCTQGVHRAPSTGGLMPPTPALPATTDRLLLRYYGAP